MTEGRVIRGRTRGLLRPPHVPERHRQSGSLLLSSMRRAGAMARLCLAVLSLPGAAGSWTSPRPGGAAGLPETLAGHRAPRGDAGASASDLAALAGGPRGLLDSAAEGAAAPPGASGPAPLGAAEARCAPDGAANSDVGPRLEARSSLIYKEHTLGAGGRLGDGIFGHDSDILEYR